MNKTKIEYLTHTWNPLAMRCTPIGSGCANCWHLALANRFAANPKIPGEVQQAYSGEAAPMLVASRIDAPLRSRKPAVIGVQFMGDLFHERLLGWQSPGVWTNSAGWEHLVVIGQTMLQSPQHTYLLLTKRTHIMADMLWRIWEKLNQDAPPVNIWAGASIENQESANWRISELLQVSAAKRFISYEPALGPISISDWWRVLPDGQIRHPLDLVLAGCESGPKRRPAKIEWFRAIRDECIEAGVPFFLKQMEQDGQVVHMPELDGVVYDQMPRVDK